MHTDRKNPVCVQNRGCGWQITVCVHSHTSLYINIVGIRSVFRSQREPIFLLATRLLTSHAYKVDDIEADRQLVVVCPILIIILGW